MKNNVLNRVNNAVISAITVVTEKDKKYLKNCLISLEQSSKYANISLEIIAVTNLTTIDSFNYLISPYKIIKNNTNLGYGQAINIGLKKAKGKWCLVLNPDTVTKRNTIKQLLKYTNTNNLVIISPKILSPDNKLECNLLPLTSLKTIFLEQSYLYKIGIPFFKLPNSDIQAYSSTHTVDAVAATYWLIDKENFFNTGGFDKRFYLYFEDIDLCKRLKDINYKILFVSNSTVIHFGHQSSGGIIRADLFLDGLTKYLLKYHSFFYSRIAFLLLFLGSILRILYWNSKLLLPYNIKSLAKKKITFYTGVFTGSFNYFFLRR